MRVIRSAGQNVSPSDDGRLFDQAFSDGLFEDATIAANGGNSIAIGALYGIICGRDFTAEAQTIAATLPQSDTATGYVYVEIDTSSDDIITIGTALAPFTPTYEDINVNGAVVQMIIAQYEASAVAVTSVTPTYTTASAGAVDAGSVATIETSPAVAAHAVGDIILYGGKIYEVTAAISIGESLVIGTNIVATSIGDEISALNAGLSYEFIDLLGNGTFPSQPRNNSSQVFTAPQNGMMFIWAARGSDPGWTLKINVNGHNEVFAFPAVVGYAIASITFPVKTGDTVNISTDNPNASWTVHQAKFIY